MARIPKILGYIKVESQSMQVQRTDGGGSTGPHAFSLDDGDYRIDGLTPGTISSAFSNNANFSNSDHDLSVGDTVVFWDTSADAFLGTRVVATTSASQITTTTTVPSSSSGDVVFSQHDLLGYLYARIVSQDPTNLTSITFDVDQTDGIVSIDVGASEVWTLFWTTDDIPEYLRYDTGTLNIVGGTPEEGSRAAAGVVMLTHGMFDDRPRTQTIKSISTANDGSTECLHVANWIKHTFGIRYDGGTRDALAGEIHALEDMWVRCEGQNKRFRLHPDKTVGAKYEPFDRPWGYREWVFDPEIEQPWEPKEPVGGIWKQWKDTIKAHLYVSS